MKEFNDKVVLVTGASSGMGQATAIQLAGLGATVICAARRSDLGEETLEKVRVAGGDGAFVRTDIGNEESIAELFAYIDKVYGRLDGAFNNAGMEIEVASLPDIPIAAFDELFRVNVRGTFLCMQHELRIMRRQNSGTLVNTSSIGGVTAMRYASAYVASKHAVVGMTKTAALDGPEFGVRANAICPGLIRTELMDRWVQGDEGIVDHLKAGIPLKRVGTSEEVAEAAVWLLSDRSRYVNGVIMEVDGGVTAGLMM